MSGKCEKNTANAHGKQYPKISTRKVEPAVKHHGSLLVGLLECREERHQETDPREST